MCANVVNKGGFVQVPPKKKKSVCKCVGNWSKNRRNYFVVQKL